MKINLEYNEQKIRNIQDLKEAERLFNKVIKQGFLKSKGETQFRKFRSESKIEDAKLIELHIKHETGKGEFKLNGNLSYNDLTKEIKFYVLSVFSFDNFRYNEKQFVDVINEEIDSETDFNELMEAIKKMKKTQPSDRPRRPVPGSANERYQKNGGSNNKYSSKNNSSYKGGSNKSSYKTKGSDEKNKDDSYKSNPRSQSFTRNKK